MSVHLFLPPAPPPLIDGPVALMRLVEVKDVGRVTDSMSALGLSEDDLAVEEKFNGWLCQSPGGRLFTRRGKELTRKFPEIAQDMGPYVREHLVGELVYWGPDGRMDEPTVTRVAGTADPREAAEKLGALPGHFGLVLFDILAADGLDLTELPTMERRAVLEEVVAPTRRVTFAPQHRFGDWERVYRRNLKNGGDGVVFKNVHAPHLWAPLEEGVSEPQPVGFWWKVKPVISDDFVVVDSHRGPRGKLVVVLAQYWKGRPVAVGEMNNFSAEREREILERLERGPFVVEVNYTSRFPDPPGALQHPRFGRFREDVRPEDVRLPKEYVP